MKVVTTLTNVSTVFVGVKNILKLLVIFASK